ncbi:MAG: transcription termination factor NusA [Candidatus Margulisiibacteriota bacterium]
MIIIENFSQVAAQIESERGITKLDLIDAISQALISASRKKFTEEALLEAKIDHLTGEATIFQKRLLVKKVENPVIEVALKDANKIDPNLIEGDFLSEEVTFPDFGRIAAQTAKQVIVQRIREAEKNSIFKEFKDKAGQLITGTVQRIENRNYLINLGRVEAVLGIQDQMPNERFNIKDKIKLYIVDVDKNNRGSFIHISRSNAGLVRCLFTNEIPEIQDGVIEIVSIAREPGERTKVAVKSNNPIVAAVGTCVGPMGNRIQNILRELSHEKIDILDWNEDPKIFINNALKPAKVKEIILSTKEEKKAVVIVPKDQLSLAIGKLGVNVRLAVKLTGWKLDIIDDSEFVAKEQAIRLDLHGSLVDKIRKEKEKEIELKLGNKEVIEVKEITKLEKAIKLGKKDADKEEAASKKVSTKKVTSVSRKKKNEE